MAVKHVHFSLDKYASDWLAMLPGKELDLLGLENLTELASGKQKETSGNIFIWVNGAGTARILTWKEQRKFNAAFSSLTINIETNHPDQILKSLPVQERFEDFTIRKVEVWGEKINCDEEEVLIVCENTLYLQSVSEKELLILPGKPGFPVSIYFSPPEIRTVLDSGSYYLRHILD